MTQCVYIASTEAQTGKAAVALGLLDALHKAGKTVGLFRPIVKDLDADPITQLLLTADGVNQSYADTVGVDYVEAHENRDEALTDIVAKFQRFGNSVDVMVIVGSDWSDVSTNTELELNAIVASNLNAPVLLVVSGLDRTGPQIHQIAQASLREFTAENNKAIAVVANRTTGIDDVALREALSDLAPVVACIPENRVLSAPSVRDQFDAAGVTKIAGSEEALNAESLHTLIAGMTLPNVLDRLQPETTLIAAGDRSDLIPGVFAAHRLNPALLKGLILVGGYPIDPTIQQKLNDTTLPVGTTSLDTYDTARRVMGLYGPLEPGHPRKAKAAIEAFAEHVDAEDLIASIINAESKIRTPLLFEYQLQSMARGHRRRIVLPEASDDRILTASAIVAERDFADITLLGNPDVVRARAAELGLNLGQAQIIDPSQPELLEKFAAEYARLREHKGVTIEKAREVMKDLSYFGTMMVHFGLADGMVSGAINTTAHTIKPSFEFIKTKPGVSIVSSSFLMCMPDRVLVFGDCAVNPNPTPEQLADIAISSAESAARFGIEPRVAMLSYSTGTSGSGADVDAVAEATRIAKEKAPHIMIDGPIQFDAAIDTTVGSKKLPGSAVAGQATVFIFPDLNTGNNTYKAVQRSSGALAIGPLLQGLNKPVNDLSRGALVDDIVNTIALTAVQAQDYADEGAST